MAGELAVGHLAGRALPFDDRQEGPAFALRQLRAGDILKTVNGKTFVDSDQLHHFILENGTDKDHAFYVDGQIEHGVERAVPALVRGMDYAILYR